MAATGAGQAELLLRAPRVAGGGAWEWITAAAVKNQMSNPTLRKCNKMFVELVA